MRDIMTNKILAWVLMYTKKIEYESQTVRAIYTKQCGAHDFKELGSITIAGTLHKKNI